MKPIFSLLVVHDSSVKPFLPTFNASQQVSKIWRPKVQLKYQLPKHADGINADDEDVINFKHYGKYVYKPNFEWSPCQRDDIIDFDEALL